MSYLLVEKTKEEEGRECLEKAFGENVVPENAIRMVLTKLAGYVGAVPLKNKLIGMVARKVMRPISSIDENKTLKKLTDSLSKQDLQELEIELKEEIFKEMLDNAEMTRYELDDIKIDFNKVGSNKLFYDLIYNPSKTNFLFEGEKLGNKISNGKMMFIYQAQLAFKIWHNILPKVHNKLLEK